MDGRGDHGVPAAIIGMACRFPGGRDPAEFHDLAVAGRGMFQPATALLFTAGAITDLTSFLCPAEPRVPGGTLASRPVIGRVPRMRTAVEGGPAGAVGCTGAVSGAEAGNPSVR
jgi:hypothetical protein